MVKNILFGEKSRDTDRSSNKLEPANQQIGAKELNRKSLR